MTIATVPMMANTFEILPPGNRLRITNMLDSMKRSVLRKMNERIFHVKSGFRQLHHFLFKTIQAQLLTVTKEWFIESVASVLLCFASSFQYLL